MRQKGYDFIFRPETADFVPEADFVPLVWRRKDKDDPSGKGSDEGEGEDPMQGGDASHASDGDTQMTCVDGLGASGQSSSRTTRVASRTIYAVTPLNPNPVTPLVIEIVQ